MDVTVVVATFGDPSWQQLAWSRAIPSVPSNVTVIHEHGTTLHDARNAGLDRVTTDWVVHLDADDELEPGYLDTLAAGIADVRAPSVSYVQGSRPAAARMPRVAGHVHRCFAGCLLQGNWLVVGAMARTDLLRQVGGWRAFDWSEDWDLWLRCHLAGASIEAIPKAVYRAHVRRNSRNRGLPAADRVRVHRQIEEANGLLPGGVRP